MTLAHDHSRDAGFDFAVPILRAGVLARDICRRGAVAAVAAVFDRSFYLRAGDAFVCIGEPAIGNGPLTLIAAARVSHLGLRQGQAASVAERRIAIGDLLFDLDRCATWRPPGWPIPAVRAAEIGAAIARRAATESPSDGLAYALFAADTAPLARIARPRIARFERWLSEQIRALSSRAETGHPVISGAKISSSRRRLLDRPPSRTMTTDGLLGDTLASLIGLGPGLTPSGDDFLMGALAVLDALGEKIIHAALARAVVAAAPVLTSPLSACFLTAAASRHVGEHLHRAVASVLAGDIDAAVAAARRIGHTSGWDMLAGVAATLRSVERKTYRTCG